jgi:hypothetical protein
MGATLDQKGALRQAHPPLGGRDGVPSIVPFPIRAQREQTEDPQKQLCERRRFRDVDVNRAYQRIRIGRDRALVYILHTRRTETP